MTASLTLFTNPMSRGRIARWMIEYEREHRPDITRSHAETMGEIEIGGLRRRVILRGKADHHQVGKDRIPQKPRR